MDNKSIAQLLEETADLLEIAAGDPSRIRSYRRAAEAVENSTEQLSSFVNEPARLLAIQGIGKGMATNIQEIETRGSLKLRDELLTKYRPTMLELLKLPGMGPKTVALLWESLQVSDIEQLQAAIDAGKLATLPRFGQKLIEKLSRGITEYRKNSGRFLLHDAEAAAERVTLYLEQFPGVEQGMPAGCLAASARAETRLRLERVCAGTFGRRHGGRGCVRRGDLRSSGPGLDSARAA